MHRMLSIAALAACTSSPQPQPAPWTARIGVQRQVFDPGPLPGGRDAWLATEPRLVVEESGKIAVPFAADPASSTGIVLDGLFDPTTGGDMYLEAEVETERDAARHGLDYGDTFRVTIDQRAGTPADLLGAASVLVYVAIPGPGPCDVGTAHASELDYRLLAESPSAPLGSYATTDQRIAIQAVAITFAVPDVTCAVAD